MLLPLSCTAHNTRPLLIFALRVLEDLGDALPGNHAVLLLVPLHPEEAVTEIAAPHVPQELLVVRNHDELEIALRLSCADDGMQALRQTLDVVPVEVCRRFVEGDESAIDAKTLC